MFLWYAAGSVFLAWNVFQSGGLDLRAIAAGSILPLAIDLPFGEQQYGHTLVAPVALLVAVMLATSGNGHRLMRRHLIGVPIGWFTGLALSGAFTHQHTFWWPAFGANFDNASLLPPLGVAIALEVAGVIAARWCWVRFGLADRARRRTLLRDGRAAVVG